jgi:hypothetical protein
VGGMKPATTFLSGVDLSVENDRTMEVGGYLYGFRDTIHTELHCGMRYPSTEAHFGPVGSFHVPFSAGVGWAILVGAPLLLAIAASVIGRRRLLNSARHT